MRPAPCRSRGRPSDRRAAHRRRRGPRQRSRQAGAGGRSLIAFRSMQSSSKARLTHIVRKCWKCGGGVGGSPAESLSPSSTHYAAGRHRRGADGAKRQRFSAAVAATVKLRKTNVLPWWAGVPREINQIRPMARPKSVQARISPRRSPIRELRFISRNLPRCRPSGARCSAKPSRSLGRAWVGNVATSADSCGRKKAK